MYNIVFTIFRIILQAALCFLVFTEAGVWTALFAILMFIYCEYNSYVYTLITSEVLRIKDIVTYVLQIQTKEKPLKTTNYGIKSKEEK